MTAPERSISQEVLELPREMPAPLTMPIVDGFDEREEEMIAAD